MPCYRVVPGGVVVSVRLTPRAARDSLDGVGRLSDGSEVAIARVRALPADGAANKALIGVLSKTLKVPKSAVGIVAGAGSRIKRISITGDIHAPSGAIDMLPRI